MQVKLPFSHNIKSKVDTDNGRHFKFGLYLADQCRENPIPDWLNG